MSGSGLRFWLATLAAPLLLSSCASYYEVEVSGKSQDYNRSIYLIVGEEKTLKVGSGNGFDVLTLPERHDSYIFYAQYQDEAKGRLDWEPVGEPKAKYRDMVRVEWSKDGTDDDVMTLVVNKALFEDHSQLGLRVLSTDSDEVYIDCSVGAREIDDSPGLEARLEVDSFVIKKKGTMLPGVKK